MGNKEEFIAGLYPAARKVAAETGMSYELILAQAALETGWGEKVLPGTHNIFNIKADASWHGPSKTFNVFEYVNGKKVFLDQDFRVYGSVEEALRDRVKFLQENPRYAKAGLFDEGVKGNFEKEAQALQKAGYATSSEYAQDLVKVFNGPTMRRGVALGQEQSGLSDPAQTQSQDQSATPARAEPQHATGVLKQGTHGAEVEALQRSLAALGYTGQDGKPLTADRDFGTNTDHALRAFQQAHGITLDGKAGPETQRALAQAQQHPLVSEATHPSHGLYAAIGAKLPAGTDPQVIANVTMSAVENDITSADKLKSVDMSADGQMAFLRGTNEGNRTHVDLHAPAPGLQQSSEYLQSHANKPPVQDTTQTQAQVMTA